MKHNAVRKLRHIHIRQLIDSIIETSPSATRAVAAPVAETTAPRVRTPVASVAPAPIEPTTADEIVTTPVRVPQTIATSETPTIPEVQTSTVEIVPTVPTTTTTTVETPTTTTTPATTRIRTTRSTAATLTLQTASSVSVLSSGLLSASLLPSNSAASDNSDSGTSTGTIIAAVAGALGGILVLCGIIGYLLRSKCGHHNDRTFEEDPFTHNQSRDEIRRQSMRLADENTGGMTTPMSEASLSRSNTGTNLMPGYSSRPNYSNPRPPSIIARHVRGPNTPGTIPPITPSFQPGQLVSPGFGHLPRNYAQPDYPPYSADPRIMHVQPPYPPTNLSRNLTNGSNHSIQTGYSVNATSQGATYGRKSPFVDQQLNAYGPPPTRMHAVRESDEYLPQRTGTPDDPNIQYYHRSQTDSVDSAAAGPRKGSTDPNYRQERAQKTLSVRNGSNDEEHGAVGARPISTVGSIYGGM